ncbi:MAG: hypothetical protein U9P71_02480, partial [Campylobacterota bacterium]|nr:hypothetical protein [Campylobacterota bacterium]
MTIKKWIKTWFMSSAIAIPTIIIINYIVDPLWTFSHSNSLNAKQKPFNERQQKTNHIYFNGFDDYDGILLGSSRTGYVNQYEFHNMNIYNYATNNMYPHEYEGYVDFVKETKGSALKYIIIGADFYGTNVPKNLKFEKAQFYIDNTKSFAYRYKMLFSFDALKQSIKNIANSFFGSRIYYDRDNIRYRPEVSAEKRMKRYKANLSKNFNTFKDKNYVYNDDYIKYLQELKENNKNIEFTIFTSPISANLLVSIIKNGNRFDEYERWLKEMIEVFGEVHHFMTINSITRNLENYPDAEHYYPRIGKMLANELSNTKNTDKQDDFGIVLTKENVNSYLKFL